LFRAGEQDLATVVGESSKVDAVLLAGDGLGFGARLDVVDCHVVVAGGRHEEVAIVVEVERGDVGIGVTSGGSTVLGLRRGCRWEVFGWSVRFDNVADFLLGRDGHAGGSRTATAKRE